MSRRDHTPTSSSTTSFMAVAQIDRTPSDPHLAVRDRLIAVPRSPHGAKLVRGANDLPNKVAKYAPINISNN